VNNTVKTASIDAATRALIVRQLGAALAEAWRREHHRHDEAVRDHRRQADEERPEEPATVAGGAQ
jgi:hypothetical protein